MKATLSTPYGTLQDLRVEFAEDVMELIGLQNVRSIEQVTRNRIQVQCTWGHALYILDNGRYRLALVRRCYGYTTEYTDYYNFEYLDNNAKWYCRMIGQREADVYNALGISCAHLFK